MKTDQPLVSIIIISFNEIGLIGECLNHLLVQSYPNYEVIVFDNASSDGTPDHIEKNFPDIKLIRCSQNLGFGGANNEAAQVARGKYLAFVNDDAYVTADWLAPVIKLMETDPSVGAACADLLCLEERNTVLCRGNGIHLSGVAYLNDRGRPANAAPPLEIGGISGAAFVIQRELFLEMGGFESSFFLYYEDTDLSLRLRLRGKRCMAVPGAVVYHNSESRFGLQKVFYLERNRYLSLFSLMSAGMLTLMAPSMLLFELVSWGYSLLQGKGALQAKVRSWKAIYDHRAWIKERRRKYVSSGPSSAFLLAAFTPNIHIEYVNSSKFLAQIVWLMGYMVAAPAFLLARLYYQIFRSDWIQDRSTVQ